MVLVVGTNYKGKKKTTTLKIYLLLHFTKKVPKIFENVFGIIRKIYHKNFTVKN